MKKITLLLLLLFLLAASGSTAAAAPSLDGDGKVDEGEVINNDIIIFDGDLDIKRDATINGDIVLFNGDLSMAIGATINGDVALMNGDAEIDGTVTGDVMLFNGSLEAGETAVVNGDCALLNGNLTDYTSNLSCTDVANFPGLSGLVDPIAPTTPVTPTTPTSPTPSTPTHETHQPTVFAKLSWAAVQSLVMALLALGMATLFPDHLHEIENRAREKTVESGMVGLLTAVATTLIILFLMPVSAILTLVCIGLLGFPIMFIMGMMLILGIVVGWFGIGSWVGTKMAGLLSLKNRSLPVTAALGIATLTFALGIIDAIPFLFGEWIIITLLGLIGLGAVVSTRFGTRGAMIPSKPFTPPSPQKPVSPDDITEDPDKVTAVMDTLYIDENDL